MSGNIVKKGTTIMTAKPFVFVLRSMYRTTRCDNCFKSGKMLKCSGCSYVHYCNRNCQKESWPIHKVECARLKKIPLDLWLDDARMMARIIIKLNQGGADEVGYYTEKNYKKFEDLVSHYSEIIVDIERKAHFAMIYRILYQLLDETLMPNTSELISIYGKMCTNRFTITDNCLNNIGIGLYLGASVIDHSCKPNAIVIFEGTTIVVKTLTDLPSLDWSQIKISYTNLLETKKDIREKLYSSYYFWCDCERCKKEEPMDEAAACPNSSCDAPCSIEVNECVKCSTKISADFKKTFREVVDFTTYHLEKIKIISSQCRYFDIAKEAFENYQAYQKFYSSVFSVPSFLDSNNIRNDLQHLRDICKMCLEKQKGIMHKFNMQHIYILEATYNFVFTLGCWEDAEIYGKELLSGYLLYYGEVYPQTGVLYSTMGITQLHLGKMKEALAALNKASAILMLIFGDDYFFLRDVLKPLLFIVTRQARYSS
ncbi:histone-lysine N-methyltransferase SMYD3 isoform X1 [Solenopsis invicta]|uniref:histone-lysine N-methyltransferase SMYD3 isoform X1 n=2 Tax=Solenopsis invicta TaxID=13686 RepID=UPI00193E898A|nr:histone-lysine N-methyltransferase SMYD3 isoform X1 [Solenopsis invicta]